MNGVWALSDQILWFITELTFAPIALVALLVLAFAGARVFLLRNLD